MLLIGMATILYLFNMDEEVLVFLPMGIIIAFLGFMVMIIAWWQFRDRNIAICPTVETKEMITTGIYRYSRNPMYLGIGCMMLGVSLMMGTASYYVVTVLFFLIMQFIFNPFEEAKLTKKFGETYRRYAATTRRWF